MAQHLCPRCHGPSTYPMTAPHGNTRAHDRGCRTCGRVYHFDPDHVDVEKTGADFHLRAVQARAEHQPDIPTAPPVNPLVTDEEELADMRARVLGEFPLALRTETEEETDGLDATEGPVV